MAAKKKTAKKTDLAAAPGTPVIATPDSAVQGDKKLKGMYSDLKVQKCDFAFTKMVDAVSYFGMAEGEARAKGLPVKPHTERAVEAMNAFKKACKIGR